MSKRILNARRKSALVAVTAFAVAASHCAALAGGTQPGDGCGQAYAVPFPEGVYLWTMPSYGTRPNGGGSPGVDANSFINVPALGWSTPWTPLGGRLEFAATLPEVFVGFPSDTGRPSPPSARGIYNSLVAGVWAFALGDGFFVSVLSGFYFPEDPAAHGVTNNAWVAHEGLNFAYYADGWKAAANLNYQFQGWNHRTDSPLANDNFVYDLTLTKTIGKWEIGAVGFGSNEVNQAANPRPTAQFALGGLVGYDFGPVNAQFYVTRDLAQRNLGGVETRVWSRFMIPLWNPTPAESPVLAVKY